MYPNHVSEGKIPRRWYSSGKSGQTSVREENLRREGATNPSNEVGGEEGFRMRGQDHKRVKIQAGRQEDWPPGYKITKGVRHRQAIGEVKLREARKRQCYGKH